METHWNKKVELLYRNCGTNWAVFIRGSFDDIEQEFNAMWNHGATNGEMEWQTPENAYFWTTKEKLEKCLTNRALFYMLNDADEFKKYDPEGHAHACKGIKGGFMPQARVMAKALMEEMPQQSNLMVFGRTCDTYEMGEVSAERNSEEITNGPTTVQVNISRLMGQL